MLSSYFHFFALADAKYTLDIPDLLRIPYHVRSYYINSEFQLRFISGYNIQSSRNKRSYLLSFALVGNLSEKTVERHPEGFREGGMTANGLDPLVYGENS
jgi:hypothetical protein